ncbi:MAG: DUF305 domain-containing protein [Anaerolineae bacterium]
MIKKLLLMLTMLTLFVMSGMVSAQTLTRNERAEIRFLEGMIDHHQMALDMAEHCLEQTESEVVHAICQSVIDAQTPEIEQMQAWLLEWYNIEYTPVSMLSLDDDAADAMSGMDHGSMGHGGSSEEGTFTDPPMTMGMMAGLDRVTGIEYAVAWLESMIDHHDDAIHMSERILSRVVHPELGELAQRIIADQSTEIEQMEQLITELETA